MQIAVGSEFRRHGGCGVSASILCIPEDFPPALVRAQAMVIFRRRRVGHLRTLVVSDPGVDMEGIGGDGRYNIAFAVDQALAYHAPMTEVAGQPDGGERLYDSLGIQGLNNERLRWVSKLISIPASFASFIAPLKKARCSSRDQASQPPMQLTNSGLT